MVCRYLLHLPGQAYSSRLKNLLLCKSTVVFPRDGNDEFWYHLLEVGVLICVQHPRRQCAISLPSMPG